jgi:hypothetical protein
VTSGITLSDDARDGARDRVQCRPHLLHEHAGRRVLSAGVGVLLDDVDVLRADLPGTPQPSHPRPLGSSLWVPAHSRKPKSRESCKCEARI